VWARPRWSFDIEAKKQPVGLEAYKTGARANESRSGAWAREVRNSPVRGSIPGHVRRVKQGNGFARHGLMIENGAVRWSLQAAPARSEMSWTSSGGPTSAAWASRDRSCPTTSSRANAQQTTGRLVLADPSPLGGPGIKDASPRRCPKTTARAAGPSMRRTADGWDVRRLRDGEPVLGPPCFAGRRAAG